MKKYVVGIAIAIGCCSITAYALNNDRLSNEDGPHRRGSGSCRGGGPCNGGGPPHGNGTANARPPHPVLELFDTDQDSELSSNEMNAASASLLAMDQNKDGRLTQDEFPRPPYIGSPSIGGAGNSSPARSRPENAIESGIDLSRLSSGDVAISGGYETDPRDGGRPIALIAAALKVEDQVFRDAFADVRPASGGAPSPMRAMANKKALMDVLSPHGVSNDRLDEVSNYYRYRPETGELWKHKPAKANAIVKDGKLVDVQLVDGGAGYCSRPRIEVVGFEEIQLECEIEFTPDLSTNGRVKSISIVDLSEI